jgi:Sec-independent protein secretion pathway component TatC
MSILAIPLVALYFGAGGIALLNDRRKAKREKRVQQ